MRLLRGWRGCGDLFRRKVRVSAAASGRTSWCGCGGLCCGGRRLLRGGPGCALRPKGGWCSDYARLRASTSPRACRRGVCRLRLRRRAGTRRGRLRARRRSGPGFALARRCAASLRTLPAAGKRRVADVREMVAGVPGIEQGGKLDGLGAAFGVDEAALPLLGRERVEEHAPSGRGGIR